MSTRLGYREVAVGTTLGAVVGGALGFVPFAGVFEACEGGLDCLLWVLVGWAAAAVLGATGSSLGCYLALRRHHEIRAGRTALLVLPVWAASFALFYGGIVTDVPLPVLAPGVLFALAALGLGARWLALGAHRKRS